MRKRIINILSILLICGGVLLMVYPTVSDLWNAFHSTRVICDYHSATETVDYSAQLAAAEAYNKALGKLRYPLAEYNSIDGYDDALNLSGTGIMGYITIPKINVELPIYHGLSEGVLQVAVGHIEGTSLPVGGASTHVGLSAHCGLPTARLFTDLDRLELGDTFSITVLDRVLTYRVQEIFIVQPREVSYLEIVDDEDLCTLVTCTPYGVNSHRLLVRGTRVETPDLSGGELSCDLRPRAAVMVTLTLLELLCILRALDKHRPKG